MDKIIDTYKAIIDHVEMDNVDKANLFETLHNISEKQIAELYDVYVNGNY